MIQSTIILNFSLSYTVMDKYLLGKQVLSKALKSDEEYSLKRKCVQWFCLFVN